MNKGNSCPVCSNPTVLLGSQAGILDGREFFIRRCNSCCFSFVENYRTDFQNIYDENYYRGLGADRMVDYVRELHNLDQTIRNYEWKGILSVYEELCPGGGRWLDYGCGGGGLVRYAKKAGIDTIGYEEGWAADMGRLMGIPIIHSSELEDYSGKFDFISAIEVIEHIPNPINALLLIRKLLKPGGVLFLTTGNAQPWRANLLDWSYTKCPDVHVSFFEPGTLALCMKMTGFLPGNFKQYNGLVDIIKYKILKTMRIKNCSRLIDMLPWGVISRIVDARYQVSRHPYGVAIENR